MYAQSFCFPEQLSIDYICVSSVSATWAACLNSYSAHRGWQFWCCYNLHFVVTCQTGQTQVVVTQQFVVFLFVLEIQNSIPSVQSAFVWSCICISMCSPPFLAKCCIADWRENGNHKIRRVVCTQFRCRILCRYQSTYTCIYINTSRHTLSVCIRWGVITRLWCLQALSW